MAQPVEVLHNDGRWYAGILYRWKRCERRGWVGRVDWSEGPGLNHIGWWPEKVLRPIQPTELRHRPITSALSPDAG